MVDNFRQDANYYAWNGPQENQNMNDTSNTPRPFYISFSGKKQVGKDTAAEMAKRILSAAGYKVRITAFAEPLKDILINVFGIGRDLVYGSNDDKETPTHISWDNLPLEIAARYMGHSDQIPSGPMTIRSLMQVLGTDIFRDMIDDQVWATAPFRRSWDDYDVVILTDCRFPDEKRLTEENGGVTIRLERDTGLIDLHKSEIALNDDVFEYQYENNGTFDDLYYYIDKVLISLGLIDNA